MSDPDPRPPYSRAELARDVVILFVLYLCCYLLVWQDMPQGTRGWEIRNAAPVPVTLAMGLTAVTALLILQSLRTGQRRWLIAIPAALLGIVALLLVWLIYCNGVVGDMPREGLILASLVQLWLTGLAVASAFGVGVDS